MWGPTLPCHVPLVPLHGSRHKAVGVSCPVQSYIGDIDPACKTAQGRWRSSFG